MNPQLSRHDQTSRGHFQQGDRGASRMIKRIKKENRIVPIVHKRTRSAKTTNATMSMSLCVTFQRTQSPQGALIWLRKKRDSVTMAAFQRGMHIRSPRISHKRLREHGRACISFTPFLSYLSCLLHPSSSHHPSLLLGRFLYRHGCTTLPISSTKRSERYVTYGR